MWKKSLLVCLFSLSALNAALDCETRTGTNKSISPHLNAKTKVVMKGQNVSLICFNQNESPQISYSLFRHNQHLRTQEGKGEPVIFNLSISEAHDLGPYKCKAQAANCSRYSREFNFTFVDPVTTPMLNIRTETDQYITLHCISLNGSLPINYTFFKNDIAVSSVISKYVREPAEFNLIKKNTGKKEEYRCKARNRLPDHAKYSQSFTMPSTGGDSCPFCLQLLLPGLLLVLIVIILILAFWILPKYKTRKAMREKVPRRYGKTPMEVGLYANVVDESVPGSEPRQRVSTVQDETRLSQEIHYATPTFQEVTPDHEARKDDKTGYVYSEIAF
ncbi:allergin-1 isoform X1 [Pteropus medius]|uniref:allergin-1 isoform X1 n=1 Tax=Pteropus vampyrus TaxID=132908 RepID=UPI00196A2F56|nr:allergin-1 isoform X1 [Pteropus giganteus]